MSPEASEIENAGPSTSVTTPPSPPSDALAVDVHGCDMTGHATAPIRAGTVARMLDTREDRRDRAALVRRPADRIRRDRARRRAPRRRPRRARPRRHPLRERRVADEGEARVAAGRPARSRAARQRLVRRLPRALRVPRPSRDDFDVVHDHSGIVGPRDGRAAARPPTGRAHAARAVDRADSPLLRAARTSTCTSSRSASRSAPTTPTSSTRASCTTASTSTDYPFRDEKDDFLVYIGRANPDKGPIDRDRGRARAPGCRSRWW